tara:strand:+ start:176 stop:400 length:225 start_codon:yes stop_codon:yes gene_type:complete
MIASYLKPSLSSIYVAGRFDDSKRLLVKKKNHNLIKPLLASMCFLLCIAFVPEKPNNLASICQKYNSSIACQVW